MKIRLFLIVCFSVVASNCFTQNVVTQDVVQPADRNLENTDKPIIPSGRTILADMKTNNPVMYSQYRSGKKMQTTGIIMSGVSGGLIAVGAVFSIIPDGDAGEATISIFGIEIGKTDIDGDNSGLRKTGTVLMVAGAVCLSVGLPVMVVGGKKKKQTFQDFKNQYYLSPQTSSYFQLNIHPNRVGIAYVF